MYRCILSYNRSLPVNIHLLASLPILNYYLFNNSTFEATFNFSTTTPAEGIKKILENG